MLYKINIKRQKIKVKCFDIYYINNLMTNTCSNKYL